MTFAHVMDFKFIISYIFNFIFTIATELLNLIDLVKDIFHLFELNSLRFGLWFDFGEL
jgi:hypothetical protein